MDIILASPGKSPYTIVVAGGSPKPEVFAAEELQKYISLISRSKLLIKEQKTGDLSILVGRKTVKGAGYEVPALSEDGYVIETAGSKLLLFGGSPRATLYSVYTFLEKYLGCGWCAPGDDVVPETKTLKVGQINDQEEPAFRERVMTSFPYEPERARKEADWCVKNRLNVIHPCPNGPGIWEKYDSRAKVVPEFVKRGLRIQWGGHTFLTWLPAEKYFADHPEYFALIEGKRKPQSLFEGSVCPSHPEVSRIMAEDIIKFLTQNSEIEIVDLWMNDSGDWCECDKCNTLEKAHIDGKIYTRSNGYYQFVNKVILEINGIFPEVTISALAYKRCTNPPDNVMLHPNVRIDMAPLQRGFTLRPGGGSAWSEPLHTSELEPNVMWRKLMRQWREMTENCCVYEYYSFANPFGERNARIPVIAEDMKFYRDIGIDKISSEDINWRQLAMYLYARFTWNLTRNPMEIVEEFCQKYYQDAAPAMLEFFLEEDKKIGGWEKRKAQGLRHLAQAKTKTNNQKVFERIKNLEKIWEMPEISDKDTWLGF